MCVQLSSLARFFTNPVNTLCGITLQALQPKAGFISLTLTLGSIV